MLKIILNRLFPRVEVNPPNGIMLIQPKDIRYIYKTKNDFKKKINTE